MQSGTKSFTEYKEVFTYGVFEPEYEDTETVMAYYRFNGDTRVLIAANFGTEPIDLKLRYPVKNILLSNKETIPNGETLRIESLGTVVLECVCV